MASDWTLPRQQHRSMQTSLLSWTLIVLSITSLAQCSSPRFSPASAVQHFVRAVPAKVLEVFEVYAPVLTATSGGALEITDGSSNATVVNIPNTLPTCQDVLVVHDFISSYGQPYVGPFTPPSCSFNRVTWNLTVTSRGRQYDRLGTVSFGNIELFRTSTAEPTRNGIEWTYLKDMSSFIALFKQPQTIIFDLGNLVSDTLDGTFNVTLTAAYFTAKSTIVPADLIIPVSKRQGSQGQPSFFSVPSDVASNVLTLPRNIKKAVFTISSTGQADEEFWWSNAPQSRINTFDPTAGTLFGYSPFREVQLFIDGTLVGVAWPFPVIFTGGIVPTLWRPLSGIGSFDLKEDEIDITPWLPILCDGRSHNFTIAVSGLNDDAAGNAVLSGRVGSTWLVTGKIFVWLDQAGHVTTGNAPLQVAPQPAFHVSSSVSQTSNGVNDTLLYTVTAERLLSFTSTLFLSSGPKLATWIQHLSYSNAGNLSDGASLQINNQQTTGQDLSSSGYARKFSYPLYVASSQSLNPDGFTLAADINRSKNVDTLGIPVFPTGQETFSSDATKSTLSFDGASLQTTQNGTAFYAANNTAGTGLAYGSTAQTFSLAGLHAAAGITGKGVVFPTVTGSDELFTRNVKAVNGSVVSDRETLLGRQFSTAELPKLSEGNASTQTFVLGGVPGRGRTVNKGF